VLPVEPVWPQRIDDYAEAAGREAVDRGRRAADSLRRARLLQIELTTRELEGHLELFGRLAA
jgi:hypothetical protein